MLAVRPTNGESSRDIDEDKDAMNERITKAEEDMKYVRNILLQQTKEDFCKKYVNIDKNSIKMIEEAKKYFDKQIKNEQTERKQLELQMKALETKCQAQMKANFRITMLIVCIMCSIILILCCYLKGISVNDLPSMERDDISRHDAVSKDDFNEMSVDKMLSIFDDNVANIQSKFSHEDGRFWSSILAPIRRIIQQKDPPRPAVILIATSRAYKDIAERLSREVGLLVESLYVNDKSGTYMTLEAAHLNAMGPGEAKSQMDLSLNENYKRHHMVAVIHDLGSLPTSAATLLHAYCDHGSAHFKKAVLLATVYLEPGITLCSEEVEAYLSEVWQELEEDILKPLISRIANNIAIMENRNINNYVCETWLWFFLRISTTNWWCLVVSSGEWMANRYAGLHSICCYLKINHFETAIKFMPNTKYWRQI